MEANRPEFEKLGPPSLPATKGGANDHTIDRNIKYTTNKADYSNKKRQLQQPLNVQSNMKRPRAAPERTLQQAVPSRPKHLDPRILDSSVRADWFSSDSRPQDHIQATEMSKKLGPEGSFRELKSDRRAWSDPVPILQPVHNATWPMDGDEPPPFPPPWPTKAEREAMRIESAGIHPECPLGPRASKWVQDLERWYSDLQTHFRFDPSNLPANLRANSHKWRKRLAFLKKDNAPLLQEIMSNIEKGHLIPFESPPSKFFRRRNPPSLKEDRKRAWDAILKDIQHGAIKPVDLSKESIPTCVCPVRTANKNDGKARFVHNSRRVNKTIPKKATQCTLETLLRARNMYIPNGFIVGSDYASGYHCLGMRKEHQRFLAFALHVDELTPEALRWLSDNFPNSYHKEKRCFIFKYAALPFGLSSSCKAFNDLICALLGSWRRYSVGGDPIRASSYIDDVHAVTRLFDQVSDPHHEYPEIVTHDITTKSGPTNVDIHGVRGGRTRPFTAHRQVLVLPTTRDEGAGHHRRPKAI